MDNYRGYLVIGKKVLHEDTIILFFIFTSQRKFKMPLEKYINKRIIHISEQKILAEPKETSIKVVTRVLFSA